MSSKSGFLSACALALVVAVSPAAVAQPKEAQSPAASLSTVRIENFGRIDATYYRGSQPEGRDYADLAALGVKTVIDLQADGDNADEAKLVETSGMRFYRIPMTTRVAPNAEQLATFMRIVNDPAQQPVYVHCAGGRHRTGVMTAVYRMEKDGWTSDQAFKEMKKYDFGFDFLHPEFKKFVYAYHDNRSTPVRDVKASAEPVVPAPLPVAGSQSEVAAAVER
ncbi:MAG TPA: dual specificity protein phosphatase family protein [Vicinamibacterales bacterium]|jgi:protein tyrosine/serine phosphatase